MGDIQTDQKYEASDNDVFRKPPYWLKFLRRRVQFRYGDIEDDWCVKRADLDIDTKKRAEYVSDRIKQLREGVKWTFR